MPAARRALVATALAAVAGSAVAGCGQTPGSGSGPGPAAVTSATSASPAPGPDQAQAERALLTAQEVPLGFSRQPSTGDATALGCPGIDALYLAAGTTGLASVSYAHTLSDAFVNETVTVRGAQATAALENFRQAARRCRTFRGAQGVTYRVSVLPVPTWADGTAALRVSASVREGRPVDLVAVRVGDLVLVVGNASAGTVDGELTRTMVQRAVARADRSG